MAQSVSSDEWATPKWLIENLSDAIGGFDVDPAAGAEDEPIAETRYTVEDDGLSQTWEGKVWLNPPYSDPCPWLEKAREEVENGNAEVVVALVKGDTSTNWYQNHAIEADFTVFLNQRLKFGNASSNAAFPSHLLVYYRDEEDRPADLMAKACDYGKGRVIGF